MDEHGDALYRIILVLMYFGDVVFAASGAMAAAKKRMDVLGYLVVGVVTGIGGGTLRDLLLNRDIWWFTRPLELYLCAASALAVYVLDLKHHKQGKYLPWFDAMGLSAFVVVGTDIALSRGLSIAPAIFMGVVTCTGGGVIRDLLTGRTPLILRGELYALPTLAGASVFVALQRLGTGLSLTAAAAFATTFLLRGAAIRYSITLGPPDRFISWKRPNKKTKDGTIG